MKKLFLIILLSFIFVGCSNNTDDEYIYQKMSTFEVEQKCFDYTNNRLLPKVNALIFYNLKFEAKEDGFYHFYSKSTTSVENNDTFYVVDVMPRELTDLCYFLNSYTNANDEIVAQCVSIQYYFDPIKCSIFGYYDEETKTAGFSFSLFMYAGETFYFRVRAATYQTYWYYSNDFHSLYSASIPKMPESNIYYDYLGNHI